VRQTWGAVPCETCGQGTHGFIGDGPHFCKEHKPIRVFTQEELKGFKNISFRVMETHWDPGIGDFVTGHLQKERLLKEKDLVQVGDYKHLDDIPVKKRGGDFYDKNKEDFMQIYHDEVSKGAEDDI